MLNYIIMLFILCFMAFVLFYKVKQNEDGRQFFDLNNSMALRGFWCLVVVLTHIPPAFQNAVQARIGNLGVVCIMFFFMTSGYGLSLKFKKEPDSIRVFWRQRLPKILIASVLVNISLRLLKLAFLDKKITVTDMLWIPMWIRWLLVCYFIFWITHRISYKTANMLIRKVICSLLVIVFSITMYFLWKYKIIHQPVWSAACPGFIYGIFLVDIKEWFVELFEVKWLKKMIAIAVVSILIAIVYLKFKDIIFWGDYFLKVMFGTALTVLMLASNVRVSYGNKISMFLGKISFEVYLIHNGLMTILKGVFPKLTSGVFILVALALTIILAFVFNRISTQLTKWFYMLPFMKVKNGTT